MESFTQMISRLVCIDESATLALNGLHSPVSDRIWQLFSNVRIWFPLYALIAFILVRRFGWKRGAIFVLSLVLGLVLCDQISNIVKNGVCRLRPCHNVDMISRGLRILEDRGGYYGFFSAHAANVFSLAAASSIEMRLDQSSHWRLYSTLIYIWAVFVAVSRVFVGKHFLGDVVVGTMAGLLVGIIMGILARRIAARCWES